MRPADWSPVGLDADPTPGDPVLVLAGGQDYLEVAGSIDDAAGAMSRLDVAGTISQAVDALMETKEDTVSQIRRAHSRYQATGEALVDYAQALERVQAETLAALEQARSAKDAADSAAGSRDRYQDLAYGATDAEEKREFQQQADAAGGNADDANGQVAAARSDIESAVADRDRAANDAVSRIEDITSGDDLNDSWWDDWGSKVVAAIADIADMVSMVAGLLAIVVAFIPIVGTALAGVLIVVAAVAAIVSALANITLAATGERSWAEAGIAIAGAALSVIGLGGAAKAATGLSKAAFKQGMKQGAKKAWCKVGFGTCFTAGTLVRTVDGDKPIEEIRAGDKVWAHDLATGLDELQLVIETFVRTTTTLYHLTIGGHTVTTTDEHPFMVANMGWILARDLQPGDILVTSDTTSGAGTVTLDRIDVEHRDEHDPDGPVAVYNFHVETHHNYFVLAGDLPVLVHNAGAHGGPGGWPDEVIASRAAAGSPLRKVPDDAEMLPFAPHAGGGAQKGVNFKWTDAEGKTHRFRAHDADGTAPPGSNAAEGPIYRHRVGNKWEMENGEFAHPQAHNQNSPNYNPEQANATHIPWPSDVPLPWS
ncbi:polymorphic toxin type 30 domain-containing protein [Isoptericola sp. NPDC019693]|uniref:polymorphic toxin type 30 domain-containing protein n=1 Tax=Isoptericola sp. NPDC019693 TaxID=3364009 RepID=UPI003793262F